MGSAQDCCVTFLQVMDHFAIRRCTWSLPELTNCLQTVGAQLISVVNEDANKTFGAVLRTPVENSKGIPHILEHSVLCGSRKYPIKEPFVELMKGSLNTFLNAFTYPDRTCYPVASANLQVTIACRLNHSWDVSRM